MIDSTAHVDAAAAIDADVTIGPWTVIGPGVEIGAGTWIDSHVVIKGPTRIGRSNRIYSFCSIGQDPQDKKFRNGDRSQLVIGDNNTIREFCSIHRGTGHGGGLTIIGDDNWVMAYCHIAHDCKVGNGTIFANSASLAGHVEVHDHAVLGGFTGVHQFCRLGERCFTAIAAVILKDVPPFVVADGASARPRGINKVGLRRQGVSPGDIRTVQSAYKILYRDGYTLAAAMAKLAPLAEANPLVRSLVEFIGESHRGIIR